MTDLAFKPTPRPLGKSGIAVAPLGWGMWRFAGTDVAVARARVEAALDAGITLFETADIYGPDSGEGFGAAEALLGRVFAQAPHLRDRMVLATKGGIRLGLPYDSSPGWLAQALDDSLRRLGVDHVDLWQLHRPDLLTHPEQVAAALARMVQSGKARAVGVSNHTPAQVDTLRGYLDVPLASIQPEFSALHPAPLFDGVLDQAMRDGMAVLAWSPLAGGRLMREAADDRAGAVIALLDAKAAAAGVDRAAVAYAWVGVHGSGAIPLVGTQDPSRIRAAADAYKVSFSRGEWYAILQAGMGARLP